MVSREIAIHEIKDIIDSQLKLINIDYYLEIREIYRNPYKMPELQTIKYQICRCITFSFHIAAVTLTNHLLEKFVKFSLIYNDNKKNNKKDNDESFALVEELAVSNPKFNNKNLYENIISLFNEGLINEIQKVELLRMKDNYRNAYSHSECRKDVWRYNYRYYRN